MEIRGRRNVMRKLFSVAAVAFAMVLSSYAMAKDATAAKPLHGKVTAVTKDSSTGKITSITVTHGKKGETSDTVVTVDEKVTKVTNPGADATAAAPTLADVIVGSNVSVTLGDGTNPAASIEIRVHKKKSA
jgi:hypothetical protein